MEFIADLHVHSKYSRATAKSLDLENLYIAAQLKGVTVVGTGDFTYPAWFDEIAEKLVVAEPGLFKLKEELARACDARVPRSCRGPVRFMLVTEISDIYKKNGRTRKNHNLVFVPDIETARKFSNRLDKIGNIKSDGRPILGLDARDLLEILLDTSADSFLIPAHIWTPWFSMLGSKSGFDSIEECFEDLTPHIFAVETGLSSDPAMNWRVSFLDGFTLVSNSDAHSPLNLGREANLFNTDLSYPAIKSALKSGNPDQFLGTFEFYPEEGKYHIDGHRSCDISFWPETTLKHDGLCPVCGKPLTLGVLYRVEELADRKKGQKPSHSAPYFNMVQLADILSEIYQVGSGSKRVQQAYRAVLEKLGSEFNVLHRLDDVAIEQAGISLLAEAVKRMRHREIKVIPGYDGQYGRVRIFRERERARLMGQLSLFKVATPRPLESESDLPQKSDNRFQKTPPASPTDDFKTDSAQESKPESQILFSRLNDRQRKAVEHPDGRLLIIAGPGTGKTRTLTMRIARLMLKNEVSADHILALTFTRKAAEEMQQRLQTILGEAHKLPLVATFHSLCFKILNDLKANGKSESIIDEDERNALIVEAIKQARDHGIAVSQKPQKLLERIIAAKQQILGPDQLTPRDNVTADTRMLAEVYHSYQSLLSIQGLNDYEDLIFKVVRLLETDQQTCRKYRGQFQHIFIDEYQDLNHGQYRIIKALARPGDSNRNLCVIGDPDQAIYGFRGSDVHYFTRFIDEYADTSVIELTRNYRSTKTILEASFQVIRNHRLYAGESRTYSEKEGGKSIHILELASAKAEARAIAGVIARLVGGTGFHSIDTGQVDDANLLSARSYADFAVLVRTHQQIPMIAEVFDQTGVPFQIASRQNSLKSRGLPELVSVLKTVQGCGSDVDLSNCLQLFSTAANKKLAAHFKFWCRSNKFSQQQGLVQARRFPIPGLNHSRQQKLIDFGEQLADIKKQTGGMAVADQLQYLSQIPQLSAIVDSDPRSREAFTNLLNLSKNFGDNLAEFLASAALDSDTDAYLPKAEKVAVMTMHAAKGLEFPVVFIAACEQDLIPLNRQGADPADVAEERRLFYVAMTRAMEHLYLTRAKNRSVYGKIMPRVLSPFLADIEDRLKKDDSPEVKNKKEKESGRKQLNLF